MILGVPEADITAAGNISAAVGVAQIGGPLEFLYVDGNLAMQIVDDQYLRLQKVRERFRLIAVWLPDMSNGAFGFVKCAYGRYNMREQ